MENYQKKYLKYFLLILLCIVFLFANIFIMVFVTGEREFYEFTTQDKIFFAIFVIVEIIIALIMFFFAFKCLKISKQKADEQMAGFLSQYKYAGANTKVYDYIWVNFKGTKRVLIQKQGEIYKLSLQKLHTNNKPWITMNLFEYDSLCELNKDLFFNYHFYCDENARMDDEGKVTYIETSN